MTDAMASVQPSCTTLMQWLQRLEQLHPVTIELGLERAGEVYRRLAPDFTGIRAITVGGTNGKGSTVAMLAAMLQAAGFRVGTYTSPHLLRYNERVGLDGRLATDDELCAAFAAVEAVRGDISLTYFEFGTLAALYLFAQEKPDFIVLEVGLGGRLDAVNLVDADVSIVTNVALDHTDWLGNTRDAIGFEKAGIFRSGRPAIFGETDMPAPVRDHASAIGARLLQRGVDFDWQQTTNGWRWQGHSADGQAVTLDGLPQLPFPLDNAAAAIQALMELQVGIKPAQIASSLKNVTLAGRFQEVRFQGHRVILDVAHNPHAAANLAANIRTRLAGKAVRLVIGMLIDKDSATVVQLLAPEVVHIHAASLGGERAAPAKIIYNHALQMGVSHVTCHDTVQAAFMAACQAAEADAVIVVTGSFFTVAAVLELI